MAKLLHGAIFAVPLPDGTYIFGRVLLDVYETLKKRLFPADSPISSLGKTLLIEMYSSIQKTPDYVPSPPLVPGAFVDPREVGKGWPIVAENAVDPRTVEFPESLIAYRHPNGDAAFDVGEIRIMLPLLEKDVKQIGVLSTRHSAFLWGFTCLRVMGRGNEVPADYKSATLEDADLRISPY